jgi:trk system potassium uptake protein TrkH
VSRLDAAHAARPSAVGRACLVQAPILTAVVVPPCAVAAALGDWALAAALAPQSLGLIALSLVARRAGDPPSLRQVEAVVVLSTLFLAACLLTTPPFVALGMPPLRALFEATSGITSTGLSMARDAPDWPASAHLLRGWLQWCGGFALAFAGLTILRGASSIRELGQSTLEERDRLTTIRKQARELLALYAALTALTVAGCLLLLPNWWEAVSVALAAISTGGFAPRADSLASYTPGAQVFVMGACVVSAVSFVFYFTAWRLGPRRALHTGHVLLFLVLLALGTALYGLLAIGATPEGTGALAHALNFVSGFTTAGFTAGELSPAPVLVVLLVTAMVVGGDTGSTAGGIKIGRAAVAVQMVRLAFQRMRLPAHGVLHLRDRGERLGADDISGAGAVIVLYVVTVIVAWGVFVSAGLPPLPALFDVVSAVSTVGLSQGVAGPDLASGPTAVLILAMLLGRLEFLALIAVLLPGTWVRGSRRTKTQRGG